MSKYVPNFSVGEIVLLDIGKEFSDNHGKYAIIVDFRKAFSLPYKCVVQGVPNETFFYSAVHMQKVNE